MTDNYANKRFILQSATKLLIFFILVGVGICFIVFGDHSEYQNQGTMSETQDKYLFFSGIEAGMTGKEADLMVGESDWFGGHFGKCADESYGEKYWSTYYDTRTMYMQDGSEFYVEASFNGLRQIAAIYTRIDFSETKYDMFSFENKAESYYNKFVSDFDLWRLEEYVSDTHLFPNLGKGHNFYKSNSLIYNINLHECHLWLDEFNGVGYAFIEINNSYKEHNVPVYSIGFVMFMLD